MEGKKSVRTFFRLLSLLFFLPVVFVLSLCFMPDQYGETYLAALKDKAELLHAAESPRIVLISGSGGVFNVDSRLLEQELPGYRAVNFSLYAAIGLPVMVDLAVPDIRSGDVVVLLPEMSPQTYSDHLVPESLLQAMEGRWDLLARLSPGHLEEVLPAIPSFASARARFFLTSTAPVPEGVYARRSFSPLGDMAADGRDGNRMPGGADRNQMVTLSPSLPEEDFLLSINRFTETAARRGARVLFTFCPVNDLAVEDDAGAQELEEKLRARLTCEVLGDLASARMDPGWFYDTNFHLNERGQVVYTARLAGLLREALGLAGGVSILLPEMPDAAISGAAGGTWADEDCFLYQETEGGAYEITGLTAEGRAREDLSVPAYHLGLPVTAFMEDTFPGNTILRTLSIQGNIRYIPSGAFSGCTALRSIHLLFSEPETCTVGEGLLDGCTAEILVPSHALSRFMTDYFWSRYAGSMRGGEMETAPAQESKPEVTRAPERTAMRTVTETVYHGNGGVLKSGEGDTYRREMILSHLRFPTLQGTVYFQREGYVLTGWTTEPDGGGKKVSLGSRLEREDGKDLYARWEACFPEEEGEWAGEGSGAGLTLYKGPGGTVVVPETAIGLPVRTIHAGAFQNLTIARLVLPPGLRTVEAGAFQGCEIGEIVLFDSLETISDASFEDCGDPGRIYMQANTAPVFCGTYFDTFQDKFDRLLALERERDEGGRHILVLASGSSGRYGYNSPMLEEAFPEYGVVNMGVYAYTSALPQLKVILPHLAPGDVVLYGPEFDAKEEQFCAQTFLPVQFFQMMESSYDTLSQLDLGAFDHVFDGLGEYLRTRRKMPGRSYDMSPASFDDDGNFYVFPTYNVQGDFILPRPLGDTDERLRHNIADYTPESFSEEMVECLNRALEDFLRSGIRVLFTYTPRNSASLTEESTEERRAETDLFLRSRLRVPVISDIEFSLMPGRYFYLIDSHLGTEGASIRTERIIRDLTDALHAQD